MFIVSKKLIIYLSIGLFAQDREEKLAHIYYANKEYNFYFLFFFY